LNRTKTREEKLGGKLCGLERIADMKQYSAAATKTVRDASGDYLFVPPGEIRGYLENIGSQIAQRAYEIFEKEGHGHGHDWDDWFQAETEVVQSLGFELEVSPLNLIAVVYIGQYNPEYLRISIEPERLIICDIASDESPTLAGSYPQLNGPKRICFSFDLPEPVEASSASADIRQDKLLVRLPKLKTDR
jgi:hypothetical protein